MKLCKRCLESKPSSLFYASDKSCKPCRRAFVKQYRESIPQVITERKRLWKKTPAGRLAARRYEVHAVKTGARRKLLKHAHEAVRKALKAGRLIKGPCAHLGQGSCEGAVEGHHPSYEPSQWLVVIWLCQQHHKLAHQLEAEGQR